MSVLLHAKRWQGREPVCLPWQRWLLALLLALGACGGGSEFGTTPILALEMTPSATDLPKGLTQALTVVGTYADGQRSDLGSVVAWRSSAPDVASVDAGGLVRGLAEGDAVITASHEFAGLRFEARAQVRVTPPVVLSMTIPASPAVTGVGIPLKLKATGTYSDGTTGDVTGLATWVSDAPTVVAVQPATGVVSGVAPGTGTVRASIGSAVATLDVAVVAGTWVSGGDAPRQPGSFAALPDGRVLTVNGSGSLSTWVYDSLSRSWSGVDPYIDCLSCTSGSLTPLADGTVLGLSGMSTDLGIVFFATAKLFDPATGRWTRLPNMTQRRFGGSTVRLASGAVLVVGGTDVDDPRRPMPQTAEIFDPVSRTWASTGNFSSSVNGPLFLLPDGKVLMVGSPLSELFDPRSGTWSPTGSPAQRPGRLVSLADGRVLRVGGDSSGLSPPGSSTAEIYDPATGTWSPTGSMARARTNHSAVRLADGRVLVSGGRDGSDVLGSTEIFDPGSGTWSSGPPLITPRYGHSSVLLSTGVVAVMNGSPNRLTSVELLW